MIRRNPTALSVTIEDVNNLVIPRNRASSSDGSEVQTNKQVSQQTSQQRVLGRSEEQLPHTAALVLASPVAASTKDGRLDASPLQNRVDLETNDSHIEDVSQPTLPMTATRTREDTNMSNQQANHDGIDLVRDQDRDVKMVTPQQHGRALAQVTPRHGEAPSGPSGDNVSPWWLSLPPRRPHPAWTAAEREIATSPLANRVPR
jgi:hypothetical protein